MILLEDYTDIWRKTLAKKGEEVKVISDHSGVLIVETEKGLRFAISKEKVKE